MYAPNTASRQAGFTLVELMVSLVIGLLVGLAAMSSAQFFMGMQRQSQGLGSSVANAAGALDTLKYEVSQAGLGAYHEGKLTCPAVNISVGALAKRTNQALPPVSLTVSAAGELTLGASYASALGAAGAATLAEATDNTAVLAPLETYLPVTVGQAVMLAPADGALMPCSVKTVTSVTATVTGPKLGFDATEGHNQVAFTTVTYPQGSSVSVLGDLRSVTFVVNTKGELVMSRLPLSDASAVLAKNVVAASMQYGVATSATDPTLTWTAAKDGTAVGDWATPTAAQLMQVRAIRVGVLVRSGQKDPKVAGVCVTIPDSSAVPTLQGQALSKTAALSLTSTEIVAPKLDTDWQCYRYQAMSVIVPLRNQVWGVTS